MPPDYEYEKAKDAARKSLLFLIVTGIDKIEEATPDEKATVLSNLVTYLTEAFDKKQKEMFLDEVLREIINKEINNTVSKQVLDDITFGMKNQQA